MNFNGFMNMEDKRVIDLKDLIENGVMSEKEKIISTGSKSLNEILGGGLKHGNMYLVFGASNTGKTQLCHQICVQSRKNENIVYYLDTENTFRAERISELARFRNITPEMALKKFFVSSVMSSSMLLISLNEIKKKHSKNENHTLIIDTINNHFRVDQGDPRSSFQKSKNDFMKALEIISTITIKYNLLTVMTAQITVNFLDNHFIREIPVGNQYLNHYISEYLYLRAEDEKSNSCLLANSQYNQEKKARYIITEIGLEDYDE